MIYENTLSITKKNVEIINKYLTVEPKNEYECLGENTCIRVTSMFENGVEMDIKCCGVQFCEGESNLAWAEAVLFDNGSEVSVSEVCDNFIGDWELEYNGDTYIAHIKVEE